MDEVLKRFGNDLKPGDAVILNDPYEGGMHLPDIFMFVPFFYKGELEGFCVVICIIRIWAGAYPGPTPATPPRFIRRGCAFRRSSSTTRAASTDRKSTRLNSSH